MKPGAISPQVQGFFDPATWTVTYVVHNGPGSACAIVDPVLDFDPLSGATGTHNAEQLAHGVGREMSALLAFKQGTLGIIEVQFCSIVTKRSPKSLAEKHCACFAALALCRAQYELFTYSPGFVEHIASLERC